MVNRGEMRSEVEFKWNGEGLGSERENFAKKKEASEVSVLKFLTR